MQRKEQKGITLIALVITIIVLLILAGISIAMLTGENGILAQASKAKVETRGASVQEVRDLWFTEKKLTTAKSLDEVLNDLKNQNLLTEEEVAEVKETGQVTIGSRTIVFGEDNNVELVARVIYDEYDEKKYKIAVGFERYQVSTDHPIIKYLKNCTQKDKENIFIEMFNLSEGTNLNTVEEIFKLIYEEGGTSKLCTTLEELATEMGITAEQVSIFGLDLTDAMLLEIGNEHFWKERITTDITGELTDPSGNNTMLSTTNIDIEILGLGLFEAYAYVYEITENGSYTFSFEGNDGQTSSITVTIDGNHPCIVYNENFYGMTLMSGIDNFIGFDTARAKNVIYIHGFTGPEEFNMTQYITEDKNFFAEGVKTLYLNGDIEEKEFNATIILTYKGQEYIAKVDVWLLV